MSVEKYNEGLSKKGGTVETGHPIKHVTCARESSKSSVGLADALHGPLCVEEDAQSSRSSLKAANFY